MTHEDDMIFLSFSILYHLDLPLFCHYFPPWMVNWSRCPQVENSETMEVISFNCGTCIRLPVPWKWAQTLRFHEPKPIINSSGVIFFVSGRVLIHTLISYYMILLKQLSSSQEILKTKQFAVFTQSLQYLFFWFEEVFTQRFFSVKHQLSRMNSSGASDLITRRIQGWVEAEMLKMTWYYPYHPCMVYLPTFGWCLC